MTEFTHLFLISSQILGIILNGFSIIFLARWCGKINNHLNYLEDSIFFQQKIGNKPEDPFLDDNFLKERGYVK
jgi:hypothetical protein